MDRTRSAAVLTTLGALALLTTLASPAGADDAEELVPFGRCDVYRPDAAAGGVDRCTTGMVTAGATVELPEPACPDAVSIPAHGGVAFYVGDCGPGRSHDTGAAVTAETAPAPAPAPPPPPPPAPAPAAQTAPAAPAPIPAPTTTSSTTTSTTSTTFVAPSPPPAPEPSGGASTARPATAEVPTDPAASAVLTSAARAASVESDHSPLVMLFALALLAVVLLGISRVRAERT